MKERILEYIKEYACREGILPTYREIAKGVGLKSPSSVYTYMLKLSDEIEIVGTRYRVKGIKYVRSMG